MATRAARSGVPEWDEERVSLAFPIKHLGRVHAVGVMTATPPLEQFELIEGMVDHVVQQLEHVLARELAELSLAEARDAAMMASQQKSDFLATVSHEIRTPLNGVLGLDDLLLRTRLDPEQRRLADGIRTSGQLLLSLINDILDFSKIEAGRVVLEQIDFDLRAVLDQVAGPIGGVAAAKGLDFSLTYDASAPAVLRGDPTKVSQVFANLVTNAVKFTERGSVHASVRAHRLGDLWRLTVRVDDTGIGIDTSTTDVFAPFRQADSSTTRMFGGTGLGLAISRELAQAMGGDVGYTSTAGRGSSFWFTGIFRPASGADPVTLAGAVGAGAVGAGGPAARARRRGQPGQPARRHRHAHRSRPHGGHRRGRRSRRSRRWTTRRTTWCSWTCRCRGWTATRPPGPCGRARATGSGRW